LTQHPLKHTCRTMRICFVADLPSQTLGGAELQCYLIGRGLAARGWDVIFVTSKALAEEKKDFRVYCARPLFPGDRWLARYSRAMQLFNVLKAVDPDIVLVTYPGSLSGFVAFYCLLYGKKLVYRAAHIYDADLSFRKGTGWSELGFVARHLHSFALKSARVIVTNAGYVSDSFKRTLPEKDIRTVRNGLEIGRLRKSKPSHVLWVGRFDTLKNPATFVRLARELQHIQFVMCGNGPLYRNIEIEASRLGNLLLENAVPEPRKRSLLETAFAFVNTSLAEGFPNTLIEAGIHGVPYVSYVDPDEVICRHRLGFHVGSFLELKEMTALLVRNASLRREMAVNIRAYVEREHNIEKTVMSYDQLLRLVGSQNRAS